MENEKATRIFVSSEFIFLPPKRAVVRDVSSICPGCKINHKSTTKYKYAPPNFSVEVARKSGRMQTPGRKSSAVAKGTSAGGYKHVREACRAERRHRHRQGYFRSPGGRVAFRVARNRLFPGVAEKEKAKKRKRQEEKKTFWLVVHLGNLGRPFEEDNLGFRVEFGPLVCTRQHGEPREDPDLPGGP